MLLNFFGRWSAPSHFPLGTSSTFSLRCLVRRFVHHRPEGTDPGLNRSTFHFAYKLRSLQVNILSPGCYELVTVEQEPVGAAHAQDGGDTRRAPKAALVQLISSKLAFFRVMAGQVSNGLPVDFIPPPLRCFLPPPYCLARVRVAGITNAVAVPAVRAL